MHFIITNKPEIHRKLVLYRVQFSAGDVLVAAKSVQTAENLASQQFCSHSFRCEVVLPHRLFYTSTASSWDGAAILKRVNGAERSVAIWTGGWLNGYKLWNIL